MSQRCSILGFDLAAMQSLFKSKDMAVLGRTYCEMREQETPSDPLDEDLETLGWIGLRVEVAYRAVFKGVPFKGLGDEGPEHADVANFLAGYSRKPVRTDFEGVKGGVRSIAAYARDLPKPAGKLFAHLTEGRPIFGRRCVPEDLYYYAYLTRAETQELRPALAALRDRHDGLRDDVTQGPIMSDLLSGMDQIVEKGLDLWYSA